MIDIFSLFNNLAWWSLSSIIKEEVLCCLTALKSSAVHLSPIYFQLTLEGVCVPLTFIISISQTNYQDLSQKDYNNPETLCHVNRYGKGCKNHLFNWRIYIYSIITQTQYIIFLLPNQRGFQPTKVCFLWVLYAKVIRIQSYIIKMLGEPNVKAVDILIIYMCLLCKNSRCWFWVPH